MMDIYTRVVVMSGELLILGQVGGKRRHLPTTNLVNRQQDGATTDE